MHAKYKVSTSYGSKDALKVEIFQSKMAIFSIKVTIQIKRSLTLLPFERNL